MGRGLLVYHNPVAIIFGILLASFIDLNLPAYIYLLEEQKEFYFLYKKKCKYTRFFFNAKKKKGKSGNVKKKTRNLEYLLILYKIHTFHICLNGFVCNHNSKTKN